MTINRRSLVVALCNMLAAACLLAPMAALAVTGCSGGNCLNNPLNSAFSSIPAFIEGVLKAIVVIAIPVIAFFFILTGFKYVTAQGSSKGVEDAHKMLLNTIIGAALILGAWALAQIIGTTITQVTQ